MTFAYQSLMIVHSVCTVVAYGSLAVLVVGVIWEPRRRRTA